jgi:NDP-hexose C3-ketoreductase / dTDP-4-oxo-2-deoxy-alpha-D-pentos-2-ene 2,3-reductase
MEYSQLGKTDLNVSWLCLGTMTMGWTSDKKDSFAVMDAALGHGINFLTQPIFIRTGPRAIKEV